METVNEPSLLAQTGKTPNTATGVQAVQASFAVRGLSVAAQKEVREREALEAQTRDEEPLYYRLSSMHEGTVKALYRRGEVMTAGELLSYYNDAHATRVGTVDFSVAPPADEQVQAGEADKPMVVVVRGERTPTLKERLVTLPATLAAMPRQALETVRTSHTAWFNFQKADTDNNTRRFPVSAFAALIAVAVSLMLIVASAVMVTEGESQVDALTLALAEEAEEVNELRSDINVQTDLLQIRDYATNELGMVSEEYLQMDYITIENGDSIEVAEEEKETNIGLAALLSALGLK